MRLILSLVLSVILILASQAEAVARSEMAGASDQILCGEGGPLRVTLDAAGRVVDRHPCTHCLAASVAADMPGPSALPAVPASRGIRLGHCRAVQAVAARAPAPSARAPPVPLV